MSTGEQLVSQFNARVQIIQEQQNRLYGETYKGACMFLVWSQGR